MKNLVKQTIPIVLTILIFFFLTSILHVFILLLNFFPLRAKIVTVIHPGDILIGFTIYLKTAIDFALFIANQMKRTPGLTNRIAIETGTALGNGLGTLLILLIWTFFKEVPLLMIVMMLTSSLVLFRMAEDSIHDFFNHASKRKRKIGSTFTFVYILIKKINKPFAFLIDKILPKLNKRSGSKETFLNLLLFSFRIPFILGLDDFAGYIPLFTIVNVFGFSIGIFFGHMILNLSLFAFPNATTTVANQRSVIIFGSLVFIGLGLLGLYEAVNLFLHLFFG